MVFKNKALDVHADLATLIAKEKGISLINSSWFTENHFILHCIYEDLSPPESV